MAVDISVVICTYNRAEILHRALKTVVSQETESKFSFEIVVIDNASTDSTKAVVQEIAKKSPVVVKYIHEEDKGIAQARNRAVKESRGDWIAFFDDDQLAERDWLKNLLCIALQTLADCVGGTILLDLPREQLSRLGSVCRSLLGEKIYHGDAVRCRGKEIPSTGNILIARRVFDLIGLFDSSMECGEDTDLVKRINASGLNIWISPNAVVHHCIPKYRLDPAYFRWVSLRWGDKFADMDYKWGGYSNVLLLCIARIGQALLVNIPCLVFAYMSDDKPELLDRKCLLWRAVGYARRTFFFLAPRLFLQRKYFSELKFRKERTSFS